MKIKLSISQARYEEIKAALLEHGIEIDENADLILSERNRYFDLHPKWAKGTVKNYGYQYDILVGEMVGLSIEELDATTYRHLQEQICLNALNAAKHSTNGQTWEYGDVPPSSARTRLSLLYDLILCLKAEGAPIPVVPFIYNGRPSHQDQILDRTDHARSLPAEILSTICKDPAIRGQAEILVNAGLRIGECVGLLFDSLRWISTSQGALCYLDINGQIGDDGKRTEIPKTQNSYRMVPISKATPHRKVSMIQPDMI